MNTKNAPTATALSACAARPIATSPPKAITLKDILQMAVSQMGFAKTRQRSLAFLFVRRSRQKTGELTWLGWSQQQGLLVCIFYCTIAPGIGWESE